MIWRFIEAILFRVPPFAMKVKKLKEAVHAAYRPSSQVPRRKPYSLSPAFDVAVILVASVSAMGYFLS